MLSTLLFSRLLLVLFIGGALRLFLSRFKNFVLCLPVVILVLLVTVPVLLVVIVLVGALLFVYFHINTTRITIINTILIITLPARLNQP